MAGTLKHSPHTVKQWQLEGLGLQTKETEMSIREHPNVDQTMCSQTRFSTWTPLASKSFNKQLFHERVTLIGHWFDLWTDKQRKQFLHFILMRSNKSQLKFMQDWFTEEVPITKLDFTTVLPRFISLYIFSFLNPHDLCCASQVSWHWKFISEQDCLWMPKCTKFGWFLPYTPSDNEYGAWKRHYISCACSLDYLTPREAAEMYGTLNEPKEGNEVEEEKLRERLLRTLLRERLALHKRELFKSRPPWMSGSWRSAVLSSRSSLSKSLPDQTALQNALWFIKNKNSFSNKTLSSHLMDEIDHTPSLRLALEKKLVEHSLKTLPKRQNVGGFNSYPAALPTRHSRSLQQYVQLDSSSQPHLVLISSNMPAYEVILDSVKSSVVPVSYDFSGMTPESLLYYVEKALDGRTAQSIGIVTNGDSQHIHLLQSCTVNSENILSPETRSFWEKLGSCVVSGKEGGHIDLFVPLAASEAGMEILDKLSQLTGVFFCSPTGIATGSYQHGQFMFDSMSMAQVQTNNQVAEALTDGLVELSKAKCDNPLEFLAVFLLKKCSRNKEFIIQNVLSEVNTGDTLTSFLKQEDMIENNTSFEETGLSLNESKLRFPLLEKKLQADLGDKRSRFAGEILRSERQYVQILEAVRDVYVVPLKSALSSNRCILSMANVQIIFSDILDILQINEQLLRELTERLQEWGPAQCLGDIFINFGSRLNTYTNFFNNYTVILKTIDKCREAIPTFRAFLKRHDQTVLTKMMRLQEIMLLPSTRFEEYVNLLYALRLHTPPEHPDRTDLTAAIGKMKQYKDYILKMKSSLEKHSEMADIQKNIQGCPNLLEDNRHLIRVQDVALLICPNEDISASLRIYEHISDLSLFLFNDALVISSRHVSYAPFQRTSKTSYQFMASVSLPRLLVEDIPDSKYVKNAFLLQGPKRQWICSTANEDEKFTWLSISQSAISASIQKR